MPQFPNRRAELLEVISFNFHFAVLVSPPVVFGPDRGLSPTGVENYLVGRDRREHFPYKSQSDRSEFLGYFIPDFENSL